MEAKTTTSKKGPHTERATTTRWPSSPPDARRTRGPGRPDGHTPSLASFTASPSRPPSPSPHDTKARRRGQQGDDHQASPPRGPGVQFDGHAAIEPSCVVASCVVRGLMRR